MVSHQTEPLNMRHLQTDADVTLERIQSGRIHLDVQHLVLHGQTLLKNVEAFLLITHVYYLTGLFSYSCLCGH